MEPKDHFVSTAGMTLRVREWQTDGPAVVLVHGLSSNSNIWNAVAPRLATRFHVVALDQRGHGLSSKPDDGYDFATIAGDLDALMSHLSLSRPILAGHSWGGNVVLQYAASNPMDVAGLVLVDGGFIELASRPEMTWERVQIDLAPPDLTSHTIDSLLERVRGGDAGGYGYWGPAVEETIRGSFMVRDDGTVRPQLTRDNHLRILRAMWEQRPSQLYPRITCPTLIVPARRSGPDRRGLEWRAARDESITRATQTIPRARVLWMEDTVHDVPLHRPRELAEAIASLADEA